MMFSANLPISIALQGGGSHGAFTAGVLKCLSDSKRFTIEGLSGTSSGAVNASLLAYGKTQTPAGHQALDAFWDDLGNQFNHIFSPFEGILGEYTSQQTKNINLEYFLSLTRYFAPHQFNPGNLNPLEKLLNKHINFEILRNQTKTQVYVSATNIKSGKLKIFEHQELSVQHLLASACLPSIHHSISINGETYWDGGFSGNPVVFPLIFNCKARDIIIILVQPMEFEEAPFTQNNIQERITEIAFTSNFNREMRAIAFSRRLSNKNRFLPSGKLEKQLCNLRFHIINANESLPNLSNTSRYNASPKVISDLLEAGYETADQWLNNNGHLLGKEDSVDLQELYE